MRISNYPTITTEGVLRPTTVEIRLKKLLRNYDRIKHQVGDRTVMPILKANAYGHGLVEVGIALQEHGVEYFGLAYLEEGVLLRQAGITIPILIMGGILGDQLPIFLNNNLTVAASSVEKLQIIDKTAGEMGVKAKVHLKIDTGMERLGVHYYSAEDLIKSTMDCSNVIVEGIFSHFASADSADLTFAHLQLTRFNQVISLFEKHGLEVPIRHMANSGAILQMPEAWFDLVRPGIMLYGVYPDFEVQKTIHVEPALSWKTRVVYFKVVKPGHPVSYGSAWQSDHMVRVVTLPVGYGDGYFRRMTKSAEVIIHGKRYPVVGKICMDQVMVNIEWDSAYNNDPVVLIGEMEGEIITCEDLAKWAETIPYEVLTNINTRVPRVYID